MNLTEPIGDSYNGRFEHSKLKVVMLYVVEDTFQYDGASVILGIFNDSKIALIFQQKKRREIWQKYKNTPSAKLADMMCSALGIREIELNKELF